MGRIAFLFAGQGAQYPGMGKDLYENIDSVKELYDMAEEIRPGTVNQCFESDEETLRMTENTQPCLFLTDYACALALNEKGIYADEAAGFSLGEMAALAYSEMIEVADAFELVNKRAKAMKSCNDMYPGTMIAVLRADNDKLDNLCTECRVYPVNYNCPGQVAVAGKVSRIENLKNMLSDEGIRYVQLAVSGSFHTPYMEDASQCLYDATEDMEFGDPSIPVYSDYSSGIYGTGKEEIRDLICKQVSNSVKWEKIIRKMFENGVDTFIECGPGSTLTGFVKKTLKGESYTAYSVSDMESLDKVAGALLVGRCA